jgi:subtilisin family serine protease
MIFIPVTWLRSRGTRAWPLAASALLALLAGACSRTPATAPDLRSTSSQQYPPAGPAEQEVVVTYAAAVDVSALAAEYGATVERSSSWGCAALRPAPGETPQSLATRMAADPRAITAEPNGYLEPAESRQQSWAFDDGLGSPQSFSEQPAVAAIHLQAAHRVSRGDGVKVAILDTGAELQHPALAGRIAYGWDYVDGDADASESGNGVDDDGDGRVDEALGHGTHVAGIVALTAPRARLLIVRVLDGDGRGDMMAVASGIWYAAARGARVINLSLGSLRESRAVAYALAYARQEGAVCVASAGNWGTASPVEFPASSEDVLAVAAVDASDLAAPFTSYGSHVDLSAPGVGVRSAYVGGRYALWSGTSMSAPFVSGTAALLLAIHGEWGLDALRARLSRGARPLDARNPALAGELGVGALDAGGALAPDGTSRGPQGGEDIPEVLPRARTR